MKTDLNMDHTSWANARPSLSRDEDEMRLFRSLWTPFVEAAMIVDLVKGRRQEVW